MLYYLAQYFTPEFGFLNAFGYITVRAGGALITGFLICVQIGPMLIRALRALKVGQYIKQEHVKDLHALHQGKAGTPTMGGLLFIVSTILSLLLWSTLTNPTLLIACAVLVMMGGVGFLDDYIKLRNKKNEGISARTKMAGQISVGVFLGVVLMSYPVTYGPTYLNTADVVDWEQLNSKILGESALEDGPAEAVNDALVASLKEQVPNLYEGGLGRAHRSMVLGSLNDLVDDDTLLAMPGWDALALSPETVGFMEEHAAGDLNSRKHARLNRLLLVAAYPGALRAGPGDLQTKVGVPGMKDLLIPFGPLYILFVILIIVATSNAVNLTDGLDGLAAGASVISIFALTGIAYVVSRADWSGYLFVTHIPDASELTVFGAAVLGSGLGFLWYNAYPAEVFMGDTGSLALGGVIGSMAILTKQELLLPIVGGLFVLEALSVIVQVSSFKLTGKRVFRMAPLHHHFELKGWSESKVTIRFWIIAVLFALMSLSTLKLR